MMFDLDLAPTLGDRAQMAHLDREANRNADKEARRGELVEAAIDLMQCVLAIDADAAASTEFTFMTVSHVKGISNEGAVFEVDGLCFRAYMKRTKLMEAPLKQFSDEQEAIFADDPTLQYRKTPSLWSEIDSLAALGEILST